MGDADPWAVATAADESSVRRERRLSMLAARAVAHCPRDLAEALCEAIGIPMPIGFVDKPNAVAEWAKGTNE